jgi:hypothetical protein
MMTSSWPCRPHRRLRPLGQRSRLRIRQLWREARPLRPCRPTRLEQLRRQCCSRPERTPATPPTNHLLPKAAELHVSTTPTGPLAPAATVRGCEARVDHGHQLESARSPNENRHAEGATAEPPLTAALATWGRARHSSRFTRSDGSSGPGPSTARGTGLLRGASRKGPRRTVATASKWALRRLPERPARGGVIRSWRPDLLEEFGVGPVVAATVPPPAAVRVFVP